MMPGLVLHVGATIMCPHGGQVSSITTNTRVIVGGQPAVMQSDTFLIAGCPFQLVPPAPHPCTTINWIVPASRVTIGGQPVLLQDSVGLCVAPDQMPQGPPNVVSTQTKVNGT